MTERDDKEFVSRLIVGVLTERITVREAILNFPKDTNDKNLMAAYHALIHYEADEDMRAADIAFKEEQDEYLNMIAELLFAGKDLPKNIIKSYNEYYPEIELPKSKTIINFLKSLCKFLNVK
ncbi:MAG: hypothetical protein K6E29_02370 [Cyanobacteria bacterium RUI128]|nr:hypothetical protein [Cyanobacteria bacterium RUI128]